MLPTTYFERITAAPKLKTYASVRERRGGVRIDVRLKAMICQIIAQNVAQPQIVRLREMSQSGASIITPNKIRVGQEFLLRLEGKDTQLYWIQCRCRRCVQVDDLANIVGMIFTRILYPGQDLRVGTNITSMLWEDVEGPGMPEDPFDGEPQNQQVA